MRQRTAALILSFVCLALLMIPVAFSQRAPVGEPSTAPASEAKPAPIPLEANSTTDHELTLDGKAIRYGAHGGDSAD